MKESGGYDKLPFVAELYDYTTHYNQRGDVEFFEEEARRAGGATLELGCGTGRVLVRLARAGLGVTGLDIAGPMLEKCREKVAALPPDVQRHVRLVQGSMTDFNLGALFHLIVFPFRSFQHLLAVADQMRCLRCVHRHLAPSGRVILDLFHVDPAHMYDPKLHNEWVDFRDAELPDGRTFTRSQRIAAFHFAEQYNDVELIHTVTHSDGRTERLVQSFPWRHFFKYEVVHLLHRFGFRPVAIYGDYDRSPLDDDSSEMIFVAEKRPLSGSSHLRCSSS